MKFVRKISFWFSTLHGTEIELLFKSDVERFRRDVERNAHVIKGMLISECVTAA